MAGFCRNCGSPLADGQGFCVKCGTRVGEGAQPVAGAAPPPPASPPASPAAYSAAQSVPPAKSGGNALVKILIAVVVVFVVFGAIAFGAILYIGHRVHEKAQEMGLTRSPEERRESRAALRRIDGCSLLSKADVGQAVKMEIVRAESSDRDNPGCTYSVMGDAADLTSKHLTALHRGELNKSQQDMVENFGKSILRSSNSQSGSTASEHPGEAPVFAFSIDDNAQLQMRLSKATLGNIPGGGNATISDLGDEAFDAAGAILFVRKGDKIVRIIYMTCPCNRDDVLPLARTIVGAL
jgi:hypothetical protein